MRNKNFDVTVDKIEFGVDPDNNLVIDFKNLEALLYYNAIDIIEGLDSQTCVDYKDKVFDLLGLYSYNLLNYLFPEELRDYCNDASTDTKLYS